MKFAAAILFISFTTFVSETVILPNRMIGIQRSTIHHCCGECKMMQQNKKCNKETAKNKCNQSCLNCPVFSIFYPDHFKNPSLISHFLVSGYIPYKSRLISDYTSKTWKPPNTV